MEIGGGIKMDFKGAMVRVLWTAKDRSEGKPNNQSLGDKNA